MRPLVLLIRLVSCIARVWQITLSQVPAEICLLGEGHMFMLSRQSVARNIHTHQGKMEDPANFEKDGEENVRVEFMHKLCGIICRYRKARDLVFVEILRAIPLS